MGEVPQNGSILIGSTSSNMIGVNNMSPHVAVEINSGAAYKSTNINQSQLLGGLGKGGGFFPNIRTKNSGAPLTQPRESSLAQNG
jgi:hypothetical protein